MARRGLSAHEREARARVAAQRTIARGDSPLYRVRADEYGGGSIDWAPWLTIDASDRRSAVEAARRAVSAWLECDPDAVEIEVA